MAAERQIEWFQRAQELSRALVEEPDPKRLVPQILDSAIELSGAERGFLVRIRASQGGPVDVGIEVARGFGGTDLGAGQDAVSRSVVEEVLRRGEGVVTTRESDRDLLAKTTVQQRRVLAILCVPLRLRGETVGAIYLDNRFQPDVFHESALGGLSLFADQSALALEAAELRAEQARASERLAQARDELQARDAVEGRRRRHLKAIQRGARASGEPALGALRGASEAAQRLFAAIERAARSRDPVAILGEVGAGKTAAAAELCRLSGVAGRRVACAGLAPGALLAALDAEGACVLEELGELPSEAQAALLARLESGAAARLVVTSRAPLAQLVHEGRLRPELGYRLDVLRIEVPPLRERADDVPLLLDAASEVAGRLLELTPAALQQLSDYAWPGNLHELGGLARRLLALEKKITRADLPPEIASARPEEGATTLAAMERRMVEDALEACGGNKAEAARRLGVQRSTLYRLLDRHGLR